MTGSGIISGGEGTTRASLGDTSGLFGLHRRMRDKAMRVTTAANRISLKLSLSGSLLAVDIRMSFLDYYFVWRMPIDTLHLVFRTMPQHNTGRKPAFDP